jgi:hypothetical protein
MLKDWLSHPDLSTFMYMAGTNQVQEFQLHDGVTTALELEWGIENLAEWYA